ncbi:CocE/NonD family hydrolase [Mycobacterium sp. smrl_JER01]|uniref:S15 peptidase family protein n=1 Tax=Mycobacterium sp. smrl_JER01 TaxID=3402633 RepID=UPI003ACAB3BE
MGAGSYVGRVGGLAVALGIGAAVVAGAGTAYADENSGPSASESKAQSSQSAGAAASSATTGDTEKSDGTTASEDGDPGGENDSAEDADEDADADADEDEDGNADADADADTDGDVDTDEESDQDGVDVDADTDGDESAPGPVEDRPSSGTESAVDDSEPEFTVGDEVVSGDGSPVAAVDKPVVVELPVEDQATAVDESTDEAAPATVTEPVLDVPSEGEPASVVPADTETRELSDATLPEQSSDTGAPTLPALASLMMSVLAAGREATNETPQSVGDQVAASLAAASYPIPTDVVVEEWTPPLEWLQRIPVLGPLLWTPVVGVIHAIPFVGDFLHPLIGFPIDHWAPEGTPLARSFRVTSFDGTRIFVNFMPAKGLKAGEAAPTVLNGPGLGLPGATTLNLTKDGFLPNDVIGIGALRAAGYNVVTWDPRGEWRSEGVMHLNSPDLEGRDMSHIISYLATLPEVALDAVNDPKIGMTGASYGGGIQLATAAIDHRIDAIVPTISWNNLVDVLFPRGAVNSGWGTILPTVLALTLAREHPRIFPVAIMGVLFGIAQQSDIDLVESFSYADQIQDITAPTLLIQGTVDTLFTLSQAHANAVGLIEAGTTTKVVWYCGGHGACLSDRNDGSVVIDRTLGWLDRYVKGDESVDTGAQFEWVDQNGQWYASKEYPAQGSAGVIEAIRSQRKTLLYVPFVGGSGPNPLIITRGLIATLLGLPSAAPAVNAVNLRVPDVAVDTHIVGAPELTLTYSGTGTAKHVYAQIVDDATGLVLGNQATPIPVELDGETRTVTFSMEQVAHTLKPGQSVTVQIVTSTFSFLNFYSWGSVTVEGMSVKLPTVHAASAAAEVTLAA